MLNSQGRSNRLYKDVVIVGGGLAGLSAALHLSQLDPTRQVTILEKNDSLESPTGSFAAAGMLAPNAERLPKGHYLDLCLASKKLFPDFCAQVERLAREAGEEGEPYLVHDESGLEPWNIGYVAAGGFLAPAFAGDSVATWAPPEGSQAMWLDRTQVRELEPNLSPEVVGGWWFAEDASVDARRLSGSLKAACIGAGVQFMTGSSYEVSSLDLEEGNCKGLWLKTGKYIHAKAVLVANGSWMRNLLPVPIEPHKGQSLSLRMPKDQPPILRRVVFAQDSYIVPKADGRIVIGATVEAGSFDGNVTPAGIMHILSYALELVPGLADLKLEETWAGLRPTTPDKEPILGRTPWKNLFLAGGYWRNGVLLAPKTGEIMASLIAGLDMSDDDETFLKAFAWDRFTSKEGGLTLAANTRYAAATFPVHRRKSGVGIAAAVGTELGSYSTAASAREERSRDRASLWESDDSFERAAMLGKEDGLAFSLGEKEPSEQMKKTITGLPAQPDVADLKMNELPHFLDVNPEAFDEKEGYTEQPEDEEPPSSLTDELTADLGSIYQKIRENKAKQELELEEATLDTKPDPGFRIFHVDRKTGDHREVPPYTSPDDFLASISQFSPTTALTDKTESGISAKLIDLLRKELVTVSPDSTDTTQNKPVAKDVTVPGIRAIQLRTQKEDQAAAWSTSSSTESYTEKTYDGYQDIIQSRLSLSSDEQSNAMREARRKNRLGAPGLEESI